MAFGRGVVLEGAADQERHGFDPASLDDPTRADRLLSISAADAPESDADLRFLKNDEKGYSHSEPLAAGPAELLQAFRTGKTCPEQLLSLLIARIGESRTGRESVLRLVDGAAGAAAQSAARWRNGTARPLEGIPFGVKDIIDVAGTMTTSGSRLTGDRISPADARVVARLRSAGAIPFAMTATTEFAAGSPHNPRFGTVTNPHDRSRWTGGSSTGSGAALAGRLMPFALGTDTGGSIRVPAAWCGVTGLKPTRERVSREGVAPLSWTLDHVGPMARSARDIACVLPFMTERDDPALGYACAHLLSSDAGLKGVRLGIPTGWFVEDVDRRVLANWRAALGVLEEAGAVLVTLPALPIADYNAAGWTILTSELAALHRRNLDRRSLFDAGLLVRLDKGLAVSAADYGEALQMRTKALQAFLAVFETVDAIVTPGIGGEAGALASLTVEVDGRDIAFQDIISRNTMVFDLTGLPALMLPSGQGRAGLPTAIQIVCTPNAEALCLRVGIAYQDRTPHYDRAPGVHEGATA